MDTPKSKLTTQESSAPALSPPVSVAPLVLVAGLANKHWKPFKRCGVVKCILTSSTNSAVLVRSPTEDLEHLHAIFLLGNDGVKLPEQTSRCFKPVHACRPTLLMP